MKRWWESENHDSYILSGYDIYLELCCGPDFSDVDTS